MMTKFQCCHSLNGHPGYFKHMHSSKSSQDLKYQSLTPHKDSDRHLKNYASTFKFLISVLLMFVPQFEDFVTKSNQLRAA